MTTASEWWNLVVILVVGSLGVCLIGLAILGWVGGALYAIQEWQKKKLKKAEAVAAKYLEGELEGLLSQNTAALARWCRQWVNDMNMRGLS